MPVEQEVMMIYAGTKGPTENATFMDDVPLNRIQEFQNGFLTYVDQAASDLRSGLAEKKELTSDIENKLKEVLNDFKSKVWKK